MCFTAPEGPDHGYAAGTAIPSGNDYDVYMKGSMAIIDELGGKNVLFGEGMIFFQLGNNGAGVFSMDRETALLTMYQ